MINLSYRYKSRCASETKPKYEKGKEVSLPLPAVTFAVFYSSYSDQMQHLSSQWDCYSQHTHTHTYKIAPLLLLSTLKHNY